VTSAATPGELGGVSELAVPTTHDNLQVSIRSGVRQQTAQVSIIDGAAAHTFE